MSSSWKHAAAAFLAGCLVGGGLGAYFQKKTLMEFWRNGPNVSRIIAKIDRQLGLDPGQRQSILKIIEVHRREIAALRRQTLRSFASVRLSTRAQIERLLNPGQLAKFKAMEVRWDARHKARWGEAPSQTAETPRNRQ